MRRFQAEVLRYDGATGDFIDVFASGSESGSTLAISVVFGPNRDLYVSFWDDYTVKRFDGATGDYIEAFVPAGSTELGKPQYLLFVPEAVPAVSTWGVVAMTLLLLTAGTVVHIRHLHAFSH